MSCIVIATGGTGGHVIPSEALAEKLKNQKIDVIFCGHEVENNRFLTKSSSLKKINIPAHPLTLKKLPMFFIKNSIGFYKALISLKKLKPSCVIGFGSYHSFPLLLAASYLKIPIVLYEANITMGKVIKLFSKRAALVASPFDNHRYISHFQHVKPLIKDFSKEVLERNEHHKWFNLKNDKKTILIMGGSQGSSFFNEILLKKIIADLDPSVFQIIHLIGKSSFAVQIEDYYKRGGFTACVKHYEEKMQYAYDIVDIVISRSGATTLFELDHFKKPAILIPFAKSKDNHQLLNALYFMKYHPALVIEEDGINAAQLSSVIDKLLSLSPDMSSSNFTSSGELHTMVLSLC